MTETTMNNAMLVSSINILNKIKQDDRRLPIKVMYCINRNIKELYDNYYKPYEETLKTIDAKKEPEKLQELLDTEITPCIYHIRLDDLEGADLSINEMEVIQTFFLEDEEE